MFEEKSIVEEYAMKINYLGGRMSDDVELNIYAIKILKKEKGVEGFVDKERKKFYINLLKEEMCVM